MMHVEGRPAARRLRCLDDAERPLSGTGARDDADFAFRAPAERGSFSGPHNDGSGIDRCVRMGHGHDELLPLLFLISATAWAADQNYRNSSSWGQSSK